jgi:hypothetical protein
LRDGFDVAGRDCGAVGLVGGSAWRAHVVAGRC